MCLIKDLFPTSIDVLEAAMNFLLLGTIEDNQSCLAPILVQIEVLLGAFSAVQQRLSGCSLRATLAHTGCRHGPGIPCLFLQVRTLLLPFVFSLSCLVNLEEIGQLVDP